MPKEWVQKAHDAWRGSHHTDETKEFLRNLHKGKPKLSIRGNKNPNWNGGASRGSDKILHKPEFKKWRQQVFERDDYTCQNKSRGD